MTPLFDLDHEPPASMLAAAITKVVFADVPADLIDPAMRIFRGLVETGNIDHPAHKKSVMTAGMLAMVAATRAVAATVPQVSTALVAGVAASAVYHRPHLLEKSTALKTRKAPPDWTVGAELVAYYLIAFDIVTGQTTRALYANPSAAKPEPVLAAH